MNHEANIGSRLSLAFHSFKLCCTAFQISPVTSYTLKQYITHVLQGRHLPRILPITTR